MYSERWELWPALIGTLQRSGVVSVLCQLCSILAFCDSLLQTLRRALPNRSSEPVLPFLHLSRRGFLPQAFLRAGLPRYWHELFHASRLIQYHAPMLF